MNIVIPSLIIINGYQGSGKSHLIKYLMYSLRKKFAYGLVITNTLFTDDSFKYIPTQFIHSEYSEEVLENFMNIQKDLVSQGIKKEAFIIFDDAIDGDQWKSQTFKRLSVQLRHYHITCIISTQYVNAIPPRIRSNAMYVAIFQTPTQVALRAAFESYGQNFESFADFKKYCMANTGNHKFIWIDTRSAEIEVKKKFQVKVCPPTIPKFMLEYNTEIN